MNIQEIEIVKLKSAEYNPRVISIDEFNGLLASIQTYGLVDPIIVNKDFTVIGGHQRLQVCIKLDYQTVPCVILDLPKKQERKLNVLLNSQSISGKYDELKLSEMLEEFKLDDDYADLRLNLLEPLDLSQSLDNIPLENLEDSLDDVKEKSPKLNITFQTDEDKENCKAEIEQIVYTYQGAYIK